MALPSNGLNDKQQHSLIESSNTPGQTAQAVVNPDGSNLFGGAGGIASESTLVALSTKVGEVQASPTANTVLDRLKAIATALVGISTASKQDTGNASVASIDTKTPALGQALAAASVPVVLTAAQLTTLTPPAAITGFATETTLAGVLTTTDFDSKVGALTETAPATDTASSGLNGRLQRVAQRLTSLIALLPAALGAGGGLKIDGSGTALPVSATNLSTNVAQMNGVTVLMNNGISGTGAQRVTIASDSTGVIGLSTGTNSIGKITDITASVTPGTAAGNLGKAEDAVAGSADTGVMTLGVRRDAPATNVSAAGDYAEIGVSGQGAQWVSPTPSIGGGWSKVKYAAQTTTVQTPKGTQATLGGWYIYNPNTAVAYVQIFDAATATTITLGTTAPDMILGIPAGGGANVEFSNGIAFANGIKLACTTTETGLTAPATGLTVNILYK